MHIKMLFIFSMPELIRHLWQLKTVVFQHWCLICAVLLGCSEVKLSKSNSSPDTIADIGANFHEQNGVNDALEK